MTKNLTIVHVTNVDEARALVAQGYCPVEFSAGQSVVDHLQMDHHGAYSHLEGVAVRAFRDHLGARANDPRFVVTGAADADATFAIASLAGMLPAGDWSALADLINRVDCDPIGTVKLKGLAESPEGQMILLFNQVASSAQDAAAFYAGVDRWRSILGRKPWALLQAVGEEDASRRARAAAAEERRLPLSPSVDILIVESEVFGFDVWYNRAPVVLAKTPNGNVTVGCVSVTIAEAIFGPGGLKNVFARHTKPGWGGREAIGGSPRGQAMSAEDIESFVETMRKVVLQ